MSTYKDYGYKNAAPTEAHGYILPVLLELLAHCGARTILDVGCGNGSLDEHLIKAGFDVYGIDASAQGIGIATQRYPGRFFVQDVASGTLNPGLEGLVFDTVISIEVVEHLYDPRGFITLCKRILKERNGGGNLILSTPYNGYLKNLGIALLGKFDKHVTALWDGGHIKFWSRKTLSTLLEEQQFSIEEFRGAGRLPYLWKSMLIRARI